MSRNSKAKRDQRKKQQAKRPFLRLDREPSVTNHAVLLSEEGRVVAAIGQQADGRWMLGIGGQSMGGGDDPLPMLVMLKHLANAQQKEGQPLRLEYSELLQQQLQAIAAEAGQSVEQYLDERAAEFDAAGDDASDESHGDTEVEPNTTPADEAGDETPPANGDDSDGGQPRPA